MSGQDFEAHLRRIVEIADARVAAAYEDAARIAEDVGQVDGADISRAIRARAKEAAT